jgi:hypothetical protein
MLENINFDRHVCSKMIAIDSANIQKNNARREPGIINPNDLSATIAPRLP